MGLKNSSVNRVFLIGNIIGDRQYDPQQAMFKFSFVTTEKINNGAGFDIHKEHHKIAIIGAKAHVAKEKLKIGDLVYLEGKVITRRYKDSDNVLRYDTEISVSHYEILASIDTYCTT
ncbi:single-stranded DNA-binding protein [Mucilaginibacter pedocola]|uniref:Single-stranded DNA-binding protein n=1 Tax=Mucilaginibacter pedocola TaxID=1792845 RepID=A0A1S9PHG9_9SPHI|nr:single-stranded DNA-binding protein [Mucilaginibacter pedocola]OOQ60404.1 hypothetical protein BC343_25655 [Mucilaginibacter pedocola]